MLQFGEVEIGKISPGAEGTSYLGEGGLAVRPILLVLYMPKISKQKLRWVYLFQDSPILLFILYT
jgi:hypothetical protein